VISTRTPVAYALAWEIHVGVEDPGDQEGDGREHQHRRAGGQRPRLDALYFPVPLSPSGHRISTGPEGIGAFIPESARPRDDNSKKRDGIDRGDGWSGCAPSPVLIPSGR